MMATKSIFKNVVIKDKHLARRLITALERAEGKSSKEVIVSEKVHEAKIEEIKKLFGKR